MVFLSRVFFVFLFSFFVDKNNTQKLSSTRNETIVPERIPPVFQDVVFFKYTSGLIKMEVRCGKQQTNGAENRGTILG